MGPKGDFMDGLQSNHLQSQTNEKHTSLSDWNTQQPQRENTMSVELIKSTWGLTDTHTHPRTVNQDRAGLTAAHISSFTVNDSWCLCVFAGPKRPTWAHTFGFTLRCHPWSKSILSLSSQFTLISSYHHVYLGFWWCPGLFYWQSNWVMEPGWAALIMTKTLRGNINEQQGVR